MLSSSFHVRAFAYTFLIAVFSTVMPLSADTVIENNTFDNTEPSGGGFVVAMAQFSLANADIPDIMFESNFSVIDAGIAINVNGATLFSTGDDASNFGPDGLFVSTAVQPDNIDFSFSPNSSGLPRLTVVFDSTGSSFTGAAFVNSTNSVDYLPSFSVADFTSLLQPGNNVIEIVNLNSFEGASLAGDYTVTQVMPQSVPEPSSLSLCLAGGLMLISRRRRK